VSRIDPSPASSSPFPDRGEGGCAAVGPGQPRIRASSRKANWRSASSWGTDRLQPPWRCRPNHGCAGAAGQLSGALKPQRRRPGLGRLARSRSPAWPITCESAGLGAKGWCRLQRVSSLLNAEHESRPPREVPASLLASPVPGPTPASTDSSPAGPCSPWRWSPAPIQQAGVPGRGAACAPQPPSAPCETIFDAPDRVDSDQVCRRQSKAGFQGPPPSMTRIKPGQPLRRLGSSRTTFPAGFDVARLLRPVICRRDGDATSRTHRRQRRREHLEAGVRASRSHSTQLQAVAGGRGGRCRAIHRLLPR